MLNRLIAALTWFDDHLPHPPDPGGVTIGALLLIACRADPRNCLITAGPLLCYTAYYRLSVAGRDPLRRLYDRGWTRASIAHQLADAHPRHTYLTTRDHAHVVAAWSHPRGGDWEIIHAPTAQIVASGTDDSPDWETFLAVTRDRARTFQPGGPPHHPEP